MTVQPFVPVKYSETDTVNKAMSCANRWFDLPRAKVCFLGCAPGRLESHLVQTFKLDYVAYSKKCNQDNGFSHIPYIEVTGAKATHPRYKEMAFSDIGDDDHAKARADLQAWVNINKYKTVITKAWANHLGLEGYELIDIIKASGSRLCNSEVYVRYERIIGDS